MCTMWLRGGGECLANWVPVFVIFSAQLLLWSSTGLPTSLAPLGVARSPLVIWVELFWAFSAIALPHKISLCWGGGGVAELKKDQGRPS